MKKTLPTANRRRNFILSFAALGLIGAFAAALPLQTARQAAIQDTDDATRSHKINFENYDIRQDQSAAEKINAFRRAANTNLELINAERQKMRAAETDLRRRVPTLKVEYSEDLRQPEVIAPDVTLGKAFLTAASAGKYSENLRAFAAQNSRLINLDAAQIADLKVTADYTNPDGNLSFAHLDQSINNVPVFRGEIKAGFTRRGEMIRVINNLAPGLDYAQVSKDFGDPANAVNAAFQFVERKLRADDLNFNKAESTDLKAVFGAGELTTSAEKIYFPIDVGAARAAWRVLIWEDVAAYYVIVDAETGVMLWRKNITEDQTQPATYNVYANSTSMLKTPDSPVPVTPGPLSPALGTQGILLPRTNITLVGNEAPYTFNTNGWIADGANTTAGNNVIAGLDRVSPNGIDAAVTGSGERSFIFNYNPAPGSPEPGDDPLGVDYQKGIVTQLFYTTNRYHDEMYLLGFTEAARNYQAENFARGGTGNDRVLAEAQDFNGTNNANFSAATDGTSGRMQMYLWTPPNPDRDGDLDIDIVIHELTHGTSNRLHGNSSGLSNNISRGMGEGWSDFYAHSLLSEPTDPINGIYTTGGYATLNLRTAAPFNSTGNYYYGIRRFPKAPIAFLGENGRPHNPFTYGDIDTRQINIWNGAFDPAFTATAPDQVHAAGEVWSSALWEVRAKLAQRIGVQAANLKTLQFVTDGMKLAPVGPNFLQERNAIIAAAQASGTTADVADIWAGFAARGMGIVAEQTANGTGLGDARVIESFDIPNLVITPDFAFTDANSNGVAEPGETITLTVPIRNPLGTAADNVSVSVAGGGTANYDSIAANATVSRQITFTVPANTVCGAEITLTFNATSSLGAVSFTRKIRTGAPNVTFAENFDGVTAPNLPAGWVTTQSTGGVNWTTSPTGANSAPNAAFTTNPLVAGAAELTSPVIPIASANAILSFRHNFNVEALGDGAWLEMRIGDGVFQDVQVAGAVFLDTSYNGRISSLSNPNNLRNAWTGNSTGYLTNSIQLPAAANGQNVQFRWRISTDTGVGGTGWFVDDVKVSQGYLCAPVNAPQRARADFDGDGRSDLSVFRSGDWYVQRSTQGFAGVNWGIAGDTVIPGDFDGDLKTDFVVYRPTTVESESDLYILYNDGTNRYTGLQWGQPGDQPRVGDFDGDGKSDIAVYRPANNTWYVLPTAANGQPTVTSFGANGSTPVVLDVDGDAKTDLAMWNPNTGVWTIRNSADGALSTQQWGQSGDKLVPADYDNDNKDDLAIYRGAGEWWIKLSTTGATRTVVFGVASDVPVPGDYDGDGADDIAVFRNGEWYLQRSQAGFAGTTFGIVNDVPIANRYLP